MYSTKLFALFLTLSAYEFNRFAKYLASPYFNEQDVLIHLLSLLKTEIERFHKNNTAQIAEKQAIWAVLYPEKPFDNTVFNRLTSALKDHVECFLIIEHQKSNPVGQSLALLEVLQTRKLDDVFQREQQETQRKLALAAPKSLAIYTQTWLLHDRIDLQADTATKRAPDTNVVQAAAELDLLFMAQKLRYACNAYNYTRIFKKELPMEGIDFLLEWLPKSPYFAVPLIQLYHVIYRMLVAQTELNIDEADALYYQLVSLLAEYEQEITPADRYDFYTFATNYCIRAINHGKTEFNKHLFELYERMAAKGIFDQAGELSPWHYKNAVKLALRLPDFSKALEFANQHKHKLPTEHAKNLTLYCNALIGFAKKNYNEVCHILMSKTLQDDAYYGLDVRVLLLKTYYLQQYETAFDSLVHSTKVYLHREKQIGADSKKQFGNFIKYIAQLFYINNEKATLLRAKIEAESKVADKNWLLEQL
ncbi:MAG: hypothetical protein RI894_863 [Bacteroidota bacterium]|jgi:hypothetical protein